MTFLKKTSETKVFCEAFLIEKNILLNPNPHCFIAITKATACG
jgi:hypothetical protein